MNIYDEYPTSVEIDGEPVYLNLDYDRVLRVIDIQERADLTAADKITAQCAWLLADPDELPQDVQTMARIVAEVFDLFPKSTEPATGERFIDFHQDAGMIRSAFFRIGVDLLTDKIHFLRFLELLADLPKDTALMRTIELRQRPIPKPNGHNQEEIAALVKAKQRVAIQMSEDERRRRFADSLKNSALLKG